MKTKSTKKRVDYRKIKTGVLSDENVRNAIESLRNSIPEQPEYSFMMARTIRGDIDRTKYKGKGRPRQDDYERIDTIEHLRRLQEIYNSPKG